MAELKFTYDPKIDKPTAMQAIMNSVDSLIEQGFIEGPLEQAIVDIVFSDDDSSTITAVIDDNRMLDQLRSQDYIDNTKFSDLVEQSIRTYSIRTIRERLKISELPLKKQLRYFILDYRRYYKMNLKDFIENPEEFYRFRAQFITDFMGYMNIVMESAYEGGNLAKLLGLNALIPRATAAGRKLGIDFKMINKVGGAPRALLNRAQIHFREFIDAIIDMVFKGWRSKIAKQEELPEPTDEELIVDEEINEEVPEMETESFSNTLDGEEPEGEDVEMTPAEIELLKRESEFNGDGKRLYSAKPKSINDEVLSKLDSENNPIIDVEALRGAGYTKWVPVSDIDEDTLRSYLSNGAMVMADIVFLKDESKIDLGKDVKLKEFSDEKLQWGYTKDLINQGYNEGILTPKYLKEKYDQGLKRFYMVDEGNPNTNERKANALYEKVANKAKELGVPDDKGLANVKDPELGHVWVVFTSSKVAKFFSEPMKRFNK